MSNALYLEHTLERLGVAAALKLAGVNVDIITEPKVELLREKLKNYQYDVVITDAFFLKEDADHDPESEDGRCMLNEIVQEVRGVNNKRVKIVVLTNFSSKLLTEYKDALNTVDYLWDKDSAGPDFIYWQITRILEEQKRELPEHKLIAKLMDLLKTGGQTLPWRKHMIDMLEAYRSSDLESQQIKDIEIYVMKIANELGVGGHFQHVFEKVQDAEPLNVAANPLAWGHLRHAVNVFWLGYYFLNCGILDVKKIGDRILKKNNKFDQEKIIIAVNATWFLASLLHDIGLLGEKMSNLIDRCNNIMKIYPLESFQIKHSPQMYKLSEAAKDLISKLKSELGGDILDYFNFKFNRNQRHIDHGVLSSITMLSMFHESPYGSAAALSVALHSLMNIGIKEGTSLPNKIKVPKIGFSSYPLAALLILCDQIQIWDRQTGYENDYGGLAIQSCELSDLTTTKNNMGISEINIALNYVPFRSIVPNSPAWKRSNTDIAKIISDKVIPILDRIEISTEWKMKFGISFKFCGDVILTWPPPSSVKIQE